MSGENKDLFLDFLKKSKNSGILLTDNMFLYFALTREAIAMQSSKDNPFVVY